MAGRANWSELPGDVLPSAGRAASDFVTPVLHPYDTISSIARLGGGVLSKLGIVDAPEDTADAVGRMLAERYGSVEKARNTLITDPVGLLLDISSVLTGGGSLGVKVPGMIGRASRAALRAGNAVDPITLTARGAQAAAATPIGAKITAPLRTAMRVAGDALLATPAALTGASIDDIRRAATLDSAKRAIVDRHRSGAAPLTEPVDTLFDAIAKARADQHADYVASMGPVKANRTKLRYKDVDRAIASVRDRGFHRGIDTDPGAAAVWTMIDDKVKEFKALPGRPNIEDFDELKQAIYKIGATQAEGTPGRGVANAVRGAVRGEIMRVEPAYAKVMKKYEDASELATDLKRALSTGGSTDTILRKLQSLTRNNASTNFGYRQQLVDSLSKYGTDDIPYMTSGQALSSSSPRGLAANEARGAIGLGALAFMNPAVLAAQSLTSPRNIGGIARAAGVTTQTLRDKYGIGSFAPRTAAEVGRVSNMQSDDDWTALNAKYAEPAQSAAQNAPLGLISDEDIAAELAARLAGGPGIYAQDETTLQLEAPTEEEPLQ
jgi:hypothetical protein